MRKLRVTLLLALLGVPALALAQDESEVSGGTKTAQDSVSYKKRTVIDFSDVTIEGELTKPEGSYLVNRKKTRFKNLIEVRAHFRPELNKTVNAL